MDGSDNKQVPYMNSNVSNPESSLDTNPLSSHTKVKKPSPYSLEQLNLKLKENLYTL